MCILALITKQLYTCMYWINQWSRISSCVPNANHCKKSASIDAAGIGPSLVSCDNFLGGDSGVHIRSFLHFVFHSISSWVTKPQTSGQLSQEGPLRKIYNQFIVKASASTGHHVQFLMSGSVTFPIDSCAFVAGGFFVPGTQGIFAGLRLDLLVCNTKDEVNSFYMKLIYPDSFQSKSKGALFKLE